MDSLKKLIVLLVVLFAGYASAQTQTTVTGTLQDESGALATSGYVQFTLLPTSQGILYTIPGTTIIAPQTAKCGVNASGQLQNLALSGPCKVWGNDLIFPPNSLYQLVIAPNNTVVNTISYAQVLSTPSTIDLSAVKVLAPSQVTSPVLSASPLSTMNLAPVIDSAYTLGVPTLRYSGVYGNSLFFTNLYPTILTVAQMQALPHSSGRVVAVSDSDGTCLNGGANNRQWCYDTGTSFTPIGGGSGGGTSVFINSSSVSSPNFNNSSPAAQAGFILSTIQSSGSSVSIEVPVSGTSTTAASAAPNIHTASPGTGTCTDGSGNMTTIGCSAPPGAVATSPLGAQTVVQPSSTDFTIQTSGTGKTAINGNLRIAGPEPFVDVNTPVADGGVGCDPTGGAASNSCMQNAVNKVIANGGTIYTCGTYNFDLTISNPGILINTQNESAIKFVSCGTAADNYGTSPVRGGTVFKSTSNVPIPNPAVAPVTASNGSGSLGAGTYTLKVGLVNGFGETLVSPASGGVTVGASSAIKISQVPYYAGGWGYCAYWSNDGTNYFLQPNANYASSGGTYGGQPFLVDNPDGTPSLTAFSTVGASIGPCAGTPPVANSSSHAGVIAQVGDAFTVVNSGIEFNNIYWQDPSTVLGAGLVLAACNRCMVFHNAFEGFHANGTAMGGHAAYEQGGIGLAVGNYAGVGNFNELISNWFYNNTLDRYITASDTSEFGKTECTIMSGQVCEDYVGGNLSEYGSHVDPSGTGQVAGFVWRGSQMASHYGGTLNAKVEGLANFSGPAVLMYAMKNSHIDLSFCGQNSAAAEACVVFDSSTTGNSFNIQNQGSQCAYSDGTTCGTDPSAGSNNILSASGNVLNGTTTVGTLSTSTLNLQSLSLTPSSVFANGALNVTPGNASTPAGVFNCFSGLTVDCFDWEINNTKVAFFDLNGVLNLAAPVGSNYVAGTASILNMDFGTAPGNCNGVGTVGCIGSLYLVAPSTLELVDANGSLQDMAESTASNVFQRTNTFIQNSPSAPAIIVKAAASPTSDIIQIFDSNSNLKAEFDPSFGWIADHFKTNGTVSGSQEFTAIGTDPLSSFPLDNNSFRFDAPATITSSFRATVPTASSGSTTPAVWLFSTGCASQTVNGNTAMTCPSSIGQVPNGALANSTVSYNGIGVALGGSANLGQLNDTNGNATAKSVTVASAVNWITFKNSATGGTPTISVDGADTNIPINIAGKGAGAVTCNGSPCGGGSGATLQTNGVNNTSQTTLNLQNSSATNGITLTVTNSSAGNVTLGYTGTLNNSGLTNSSTTVNGTTCTLGSTCTISASGSSSIFAYTGDGSDGNGTSAIVFDGVATVCGVAPISNVYTLSRDCYFDTFGYTINNGITIKPSNFVIFSNGTATINGAISAVGGNGGAGGASSGTNHSTGGSAGAAGGQIPAGSLPASGGGVTGKAGVAGGTGAGTAGTQGTAGALKSNALVSTTCNAGVAGGPGGSGSGGAGGTGGSTNPTVNSVLASRLPRHPIYAINMYDNTGTAYTISCIEPGNNAGGAGGGDGTNNGGAGGSSGGGGAQGGFIVLVAPTITIGATGSLASTGGNGGNGGNGGSPTTGNCGGGGGGSGGPGGNGGAIALVYNTLTNNGSITEGAGSGGSAGSAGTGIGTGNAGTNGSAGTAGIAGSLWQIKLP